MTSEQGLRGCKGRLEQMSDDAGQSSQMPSVMAGFAGKGVEAMWDGAPNDFNIREDFPVKSLEQALTAFAQGVARRS